MLILKDLEQITSATIDGSAHTVSADSILVGVVNAANNSAGSTTIAVTGMPTLTCLGNNANGSAWYIPFCIPVKSGSSYTITVGTDNGCSASLIAIT